jgi:electron transport complex protein RnfB
VLFPSAVKCVHSYGICGYCNLCFGFLQPNQTEQNTAVENQMCPTSAIKRTLVEGPYYEYRIDESLCVGCSKCVKGCSTFGNGAMHLQIRHDVCVNCNECTIARACPTRAFERRDAKTPYKIKASGSGKEG